MVNVNVLPEPPLTFDGNRQGEIAPTSVQALVQIAPLVINDQLANAEQLQWVVSALRALAKNSDTRTALNTEQLKLVETCSKSEQNLTCATAALDQAQQVGRFPTPPRRRLL